MRKKISCHLTVELIYYTMVTNAEACRTAARQENIKTGDCYCRRKKLLQGWPTLHEKSKKSGGKTTAGGCCQHWCQTAVNISKSCCIALHKIAHTKLYVVIVFVYLHV